MLLPVTARFAPSRVCGSQRLVLFDVMDTLVRDPFFMGFEKDLFGIQGGIGNLFAIKDQESFVAFEKGEITEEEHFASYFTDRAAGDGDAVTRYLRERYAWLPGMRELASELKAAGVPMAAFSNYPAPWAPLVEQSVGLSTIVPWAFVSGERGVRKPSREAFEAVLEAVGRTAAEVVFVDDSKANTDAATEFGIASIRFEGAEALRPALWNLLGLDHVDAVHEDNHGPGHRKSSRL
jgi:HAD superfamily hydrolase (TIGR01509 family)